ncbi:FtsX-like permease family protein [Bacteroides cellulosilyticus]|uniref:ABC transporter permease n=2 Tax=Bacteroides cellulosilyticus TaxID=246787 RepID=UPI001230DB0B|nr:ABC transporter permease [Bacteroides cellulosilyticus]KAA5426746.1 FtsX-like permease family protein [Bacteroides cellulosilyticus]KAA5436516.1 FtsX-like permease family protein [Bacteroides cellulosilyticus]KAA5438383.1 FtsX-like permease family protein [Bacteroides cellulosilyticus]KAA5466043.1 FtsX-like permease family protein [Bacteroides cellulosilyticus]UWZ92008.1 ABC transporter permease [Bacteroides cellulosilyticus]
MIQHYFKIAFRNILKYKTQSIISILGLAVGFTCFALANLWIHYEMTYDAYHEGADRMYILCKESVFGVNGYSTSMPYPASTLLKNDFPEVEAACAYTRWGQETDVKADGRVVRTCEMQADSCFMNMFNISVLSGSMDFMYSDEKIALTEDVAMRLFGSVDVLGKEVKNYNDDTRTVCAILANLNHSNMTFGCWGQGEYFRKWQNDWYNGSFEIIIKLRKGTNPIAFQRKLAANETKADPRDPHGVFENIRLIPLDEYHYSSINRYKSFQFYYLILFSVAGALVILCSLFNYLSLFITRMRIRSREIELRKVCGSSIGGVVILLFIEYLYIILLSGILGMALVEMALSAFKKMSGVSGNIYGESLLYFVGILLLSLLLLVPFAIRRSHIRNTGNKYMLRKVSIAFQLAIGLLVTFCIIVMMKQIYFLTNTDLGWERKNIASINLLYPDKDFETIADKIKQFSCTKEVITGHCCLLPKSSGFSQSFKNWDGKEDGMKSIDMLSLWNCEKIVSFYNLQLLEGEMVKPTETNKIMINESAVKALGMSEPIGKKLYLDNRAWTITGIIKDFHITAPTEPVQPYTLITEDILKNSGFSIGKGQILIKFHDGKWKELKQQIDSIFNREYPEVRYKLFNTEEEYAGYLKSENALVKLLSFVAVVCVLIAAFGIFSLITLSCEQRRKEIAVRKVNGATIRNILIMFVKEYMLLLTIAAVIAFPVGYVLMKLWLENYVERTVISAWIYFAIFGGIMIVIFACIGWRVWQAARQNPAEVIKSE